MVPNWYPQIILSHGLLFGGSKSTRWLVELRGIPFLFGKPFVGVMSTFGIFFVVVSRLLSLFLFAYTIYIIYKLMYRNHTNVHTFIFGRVSRSTSSPQIQPLPWQLSKKEVGSSHGCQGQKDGQWTGKAWFDRAKFTLPVQFKFLVLERQPHHPLNLFQIRDFRFFQIFEGLILKHYI